MTFQEQALVNHAAELLADELHRLAHTAGQLFQSNVGLLIQSLQIDLISADLPQGPNTAAEQEAAYAQTAYAENQRCGNGPCRKAHQMENAGDQRKGKACNGENAAKNGFENALGRLTVGAAV